MSEANEWIPLGNQVKEISETLRTTNNTLPEIKRHFSQGEDFFISFSEPIVIPAFPIHHDVRNIKPQQSLSESLLRSIQNICKVLPGLLHGLQFFFHPRDPLRPAFYKRYAVQGKEYVYILRLDLSYRPNIHTVIERGTNDVSSSYSTKCLFLDLDVIPVAEMSQTEHGISARINRSISDTWIGETGRGYFVQGIWIDRDLTRFFSRLFFPKNRQYYPFFPITCKYQAICHTPINLGEDRIKTLPFAHRASLFLENYLEEIQQVLRKQEFSEKLPLFEEIRQLVPVELIQVWQRVKIEPYLNENNQREFLIIDTA